MQMTAISTDKTSTDGIRIISDCELRLEFYYATGTGTVTVQVRQGVGSAWHDAKYATAADPLTGTTVAVTGTAKINLEASAGEEYRLVSTSTSGASIKPSFSGRGAYYIPTLA